MMNFEIASYFRRMKESFDVYTWVFRHTVPERSKKHFNKMLIPMFFYEGFGMVIPFCFGLIVDAIIHQEKSRMLIYFLGILILMICRLFLHQFYMVQREYIKGYNEAELNGFITRKLVSKSIGQHLRFKEELSQSSMSRARGSIRYLTSLMLFEGITSTYSLTLSFCFIWFLAPFAGLVLLVAFLIYIFGSLIMNKTVIEQYGPIDVDFKSLNDKIEECWSKSPRILALGKGLDVAEILTNRYDNVNDRSRNFWIGFIKKITFKDLVNVCALGIIWGYYIFEASGESEVITRSVGFLVPLFSWSWSVVNNIWRIGHIEQEFNWCLPSVKKLKGALELEPDIVDCDPLILSFDKTPSITFENVSFNHVSDDTVKETIRALSFSILPGEKVALIGSSGAGKTTIAKLLQRAYDPDQGSIMIDGYDLRRVSIKAWNEVVGEIPQQVDIFYGTLRDNLLFAVNSSEHDEYTDEVLKRTMDHFVIDFCNENGLDTKLGPDGIRLSGGQQQRVAIAQIALKKQSCVYIIDEATSNLDATTEKEVQNGFLKLLAGEKSALVVAHNLSTVRNICNKFIILRSIDDLTDGESQIEAVGNSFEEIYPHSPILRRLMQDQGLKL